MDYLGLMKILLFLIFLVLFLVSPDLRALSKQKKITLEPIKKYCNKNRASERGEIYSLYLAYNRLTDRDIFIQKRLISRYRQKQGIVEHFIELFSKLIYPLFTFVILFSFTGINSLYQQINSKMDMSTEKNVFFQNINDYSDIVINTFYKPILLLTYFIGILFLLSLCLKPISASKDKFFSLHEEIIDKIIDERDLSKKTLSNKN